MTPITLASADRLFVAPACNQYNFLMEETAQDDGLGAFFGVLPRLFGIAYRMLGSAAEDEDLVQDVWIRWQAAGRKAVQDPPAFLATITTRLAINVVKSARSRREEYFGIWLPEPVDTSADPGLGAQRSQALEFAVLLLLERLAPNERAAYILREAFDYAYDEIGEILKVSEANARQLVTRARKHITEGRRRPVEAVEQRRLLDKFIAAAQTGELAALEALFAPDIVSYSDGGGLVRAAGKPISGRERVARFISTFATHFWKGVTVSAVEANGQRCALVSRDGTAVALVTVGASEEGIDQIMWMLRPSKLAGVLTPQT
jgi:RNA polymerase sigma factor (sigma-70 family)